MSDENGAADSVAMHCLVSGRVQGVSYRAATVARARGLGLVGWVRNLDDGRVELYACGSARALDALEDWCRRGPPLARVSGLRRGPAAVQALEGFHQR